MAPQELAQAPGLDHDIGPLRQIPVGEGRNFDVAGMPIAVFHSHGGRVYATQPECPHRQGPLADGLMGGTTLICPLHERAFSLETGEETGSDCRLTVYPARITSEETIVVQIPADLSDRGAGLPTPGV